MPGIEVGSAYARFLLELTEFREQTAEARSTLAALREEAKAPIVAKFVLQVDRSQLTAIARSVQQQEQELLKANPIVQEISVKLNQRDLAAAKRELKQVHITDAIAAAGGGQTALSAVQQTPIDRTASTQAKTALEEARARAENAKAAAEETTRLNTALTEQRERLGRVERDFLAAEARAQKEIADAERRAAVQEEGRNRAAERAGKPFTEVQARRVIVNDAQERLGNVTKNALPVQAAFDLAAKKVRDLTGAIERSKEAGDDVTSMERALAKAQRDLTQATNAQNSSLNHIHRLQAEHAQAQIGLNAALERQAAGLELPDISRELAGREQRAAAAAGKQAELDSTLIRIREQRVEAEERLRKATQASHDFLRDTGPITTDEQEAARKALAKEQRSAAVAAGKLRNQETTAQNDALQAAHNLAVARESLATTLEVEIAAVKREIAETAAFAQSRKTKKEHEEGRGPQLSFADAPSNDTAAAEALRLKAQMGELTAEMAQTQTALDVLTPAANAVSQAELDVAAALEALEVAVRVETAAVGAPTTTAPEIIQRVASNVAPAPEPVIPVDTAARDLAMSEVRVARERVTAATKAAEQYGRLEAELALQRAKFLEAERSMLLAERQAVVRGAHIRPAQTAVAPADAGIIDAAVRDLPGMGSIRADTSQAAAIKQEAADKVKAIQDQLNELGKQGQSSVQLVSAIKVAEAELGVATRAYEAALRTEELSYNYAAKVFEEHAAVLRRRGQEVSQENLLGLERGRRNALRADKPFLNAQMLESDAALDQHQAEIAAGKARIARQELRGVAPREDQDRAQAELEAAEAALTAATEKLTRSRVQRDNAENRVTQDFRMASLHEWEATLPRQPDTVAVGAQARADEMRESMAKATSAIDAIVPKMEALGDVTGELTASTADLTTKERTATKASTASDQFLPDIVPVQAVSLDPAVVKYQKEVEDHRKAIQEEAEIHREATEEAKVAIAKGQDNLGAERRAGGALHRLADSQHKLGFSYLNLQRAVDMASRQVEGEIDYYRQFAAQNPNVKDPQVEIARKRRDRTLEEVAEAETVLGEKKAAFDAMKAQSSAGGRDRRQEGDIDGGLAQNEWENAEWRLTDAKNQLAKQEGQLVAAIQAYEAAQQERTDAINKAAQAATVDATAVAAQAAAQTPPRTSNVRRYTVPAAAAAPAAPGEGATMPANLASVDQATALAHVANVIGKVADATKNLIGLSADDARVAVAQANRKKEYADVVTILADQLRRVTDDLPRQIALTNQLARAEGIVGREKEKTALAAREQAVQAEKLALAQAKATGDPQAVVTALTSQLDVAKDAGDVPRQIELRNQLTTAENNLTAAKQRGLAETRAALVAGDKQVADGARLLAQQGEYGQALTALDARIKTIINDEERRIALARLAIRIDREGVAIGNQLADAETRRHLAARDLQPALAQNRAEQAIITSLPADQQTLEDKQRLAELGVEQAEIERRIADEASRHAKALITLDRVERDFAGALKLVDEGLALTLRAGKDVDEQTTVHINLLKLRRQIEIEAERETRKVADSDIAAAKAARNRTLAQELLNAELERTRRLPTELGGAGGAGLPPSSGGGPPTIPPDDRTPRIAQLQKESQVIAAMPTFWGRAAAGAMRYIGPLALVTLGYKFVSGAAREAHEAIDTIASNDLATRQLQALFNNMQRGTDTMQSAILFGREFNRTQKEMGEAAGEAGIILQTTSVNASKAFEIIERLRTRAPQQNFAAGVRSIAELQSGQLQSIERVFNVPRRFAKEMSDAIKQGEDPLIAVDRVLNKLGQTSELLEAQTEGPLAGFKALGVASERLAVDIGHGLMPILQASAGELTRNANSTAVFLENIGRPPDVHNIVAAYDEIWRAHHRAFQEGDAAGVLRNDPFSVTGTLARAVELQRAEDERNQGLQRTALTIEQIRINALKAAPALANFLNVPQVEKEVAAVVDLNSRVNALVARYTTEQSTAQEFFEGIQKARKEAGDIDVDPSLAVEGLQQIDNKFNTVEDRLAAATTLAGQFSRAMGDPDLHLSDKLGADLQAVIAYIVKLDSMLPLDVEIRVKKAEQFTAFTNAVSSAATTMNEGLKDNEKELTDATSQALEDRTNAYIDYVTNVAKLNDQLVRQQTRANNELAYNQQLALDNFAAEQSQSVIDRNTDKILNEREFYRNADQQRREFERGQNQSRDAFNRQELRGNEDYQRQLERQGEDRATAQFRKERDRRKEDEQDEKQHRDTLLRMQRDYMIDASRSFEDFELERLVLLAEGRIAEAQVLQSRFEVERRRKAEDFSRDVSDVGDQHGRGQADRDTQRQQEDADAAEDQKRADDRAKADRERQVRQAREDFEFQQALAQQNQQHQEELAEANYRHQVELQDQQFNDQFARREAQFARQQEAERTALAHQQELERADRDQAVIDAGTAFDAQLAAIDKRLADEAQKYKDKKQELVDAFDAVYVEQERLLAAHQKEIDRIEELKKTGIDEKEAAVIASLETARDEYARVLGETKEHFKNFTVTEEIDRINREIAALLEAARGDGTLVRDPDRTKDDTFKPSVTHPNAPDATKDDTFIPPASIIPPVTAVQTQTTAVARETAKYIATERTKDDTFIKDTETALTQHQVRVLDSEKIQQEAIAGIFTDKQTGITATVTTEQRKVETVVSGTNQRVKDDTYRKQGEVHQNTVRHTAAETTAYDGMNKDIITGQNDTAETLLKDQERNAGTRRAEMVSQLSGLTVEAVAWTALTLGAVADTITSIINSIPTAVDRITVDQSHLLRPQVTAGGTVMNDRISDDPRVNPTALKIAFGNDATLGSTFDADRKRGEGVPVPGTDHDAHAGIDVTMTRGSKVKSPIRFRVTKVSRDQFGTGWTVKGVDELGRQWLFAHLVNTGSIKVGQWIEQGGYLGTIGEMGHVHVQLRASDNDTLIPIDPSAAIDEAAGVRPAGQTAKSVEGQTSFNALSTSPETAGGAWGQTFRDAAASRMAPLTLDILPNMRDLDPLKAMALSSSSLGGANRPATIHVHVHTGDVKMDGRVVGELIAPVVDEILSDGVQGAADVQNAVYTPGTYQRAFRSPN